MGKIASKIWSKGLLGGFGIPELSKPLEPLTFWSRADLIEAYQHFLDDCSQTLDRHEFTDVFQCFSDTISADAAFHALHPRKGKLDGNTIFGAVVATSNQTFISKVSLIYSIYDMDGDGALNKAEFTIVLRSLLHGLRLFYNDAVMPNDAELEVAIDECFKRIDCDRSGYITLGEFLVYAYRNRELQEMFETVPDDAPLSARAPRRRHTGGMVRPVKADGQGTWCGSVAYAKLTGRTGDEKGMADDRIDTRMDTSASVASTVEVSMPATLAHTDLLAEVEALSAHFQRILLDPQVRHRLEWLQPSPLSLRAFLCLSFWSLTPTNIECILAWGKAFRAAEVLKDLLSTEAVLVSDDEIDVLFANIDIDSSGDLTISELGRAKTRDPGQDLKSLEDLWRCELFPCYVEWAWSLRGSENHVKGKLSNKQRSQEFEILHGDFLKVRTHIDKKSYSRIKKAREVLRNEVRGVAAALAEPEEGAEDRQSSDW
eukprot:g3754.t1